METAGILFHDRPSSRFRKFNWQFLAFWIIYIGVMLGIGYAFF
jgi:hypothetical protein